MREVGVGRVHGQGVLSRGYPASFLLEGLCTHWWFYFTSLVDSSLLEIRKYITFDASWSYTFSGSALFDNFQDDLFHPLVRCLEITNENNREESYSGSVRGIVKPITFKKGAKTFARRRRMPNQTGFKTVSKDSIP